MAVVTHIVSRNASDAAADVDGINKVIIAIDDAVDTTSALILARAVTVVRAAGSPVPEGYFDANELLATRVGSANEFIAFGDELR